VGQRAWMEGRRRGVCGIEGRLKRGRWAPGAGRAATRSPHSDVQNGDRGGDARAKPRLGAFGADSPLGGSGGDSLFGQGVRLPRGRTGSDRCRGGEGRDRERGCER
jgi:hypothetical protein